MTRELIGTEQAGWTSSYDEYPGSSLVDTAGLGATDGKLVVFTPTQQVVNPNSPAACVNGPLEDLQFTQFLRINAQLRGRQAPERSRILIVVKTEYQLYVR